VDRVLFFEDLLGVFVHPKGLWRREKYFMNKSEQEANHQKDTCSETRSNGHRCQAMAMHGSRYCFFHDPAKRKEWKAAQRQGGQTNGPAVLPADAADVTLHSGKDVAAFLAETINQVRKGRIAPKIASTVGYLSSLLMKALETSDLEERLAMVEETLKARRPDESIFNLYEDEEVDHGNGSEPETP
jgi:hypothetical protein